MHLLSDVDSFGSVKDRIPLRVPCVRVSVGVDVSPADGEVPGRVGGGKVRA